MKTLSSTCLKPRNPLAALARRRRAGSHRPSVSAMRRDAARAVQRELHSMKSPEP